MGSEVGRLLLALSSGGSASSSESHWVHDHDLPESHICDQMRQGHGGPGSLPAVAWLWWAVVTLEHPHDQHDFGDPHSSLSMTSPSSQTAFFMSIIPNMWLIFHTCILGNLICAVNWAIGIGRYKLSDKKQKEEHFHFHATSILSFFPKVLVC